MTGLLGGAFDPPHNGHVALAGSALDHFLLDRLLVLVTAAPAHKPVETEVATRVRLSRAAFADVPRTEVGRDDHRYTIDLLRDPRFDVGDDAILLVGADQLADFLSWKEPGGVLELVRLGVATRPGYPRERLEPVLRALEQPERVELFTIPDVPVSSTEIRARAARGEPLEGLVPPAVARLIAALGLYHAVDRPPGTKLP